MLCHAELLFPRTDRLVRVRDQRTVVNAIQHAVVVIVRIAGVAAVRSTVRIELVRIDQERTVVSAIEHAVVFCRDATISPGDLPFSKKPASSQEPPAELGSTAGPSLDPLVDLPYREAKDRAVHAFESSYFNALLQRAGGNVSEAARQAGLDRSNFRRAAKRAGVRMRDEGG